MDEKQKFEGSTLEDALASAGEALGAPVSLIEYSVDTRKGKGKLLWVLVPMNHMRIFGPQYIHPDLEKYRILISLY